MDKLKPIAIVEIETLIDYLKTTETEAWTEEGWNNLFDELMTSTYILEEN